MMTSLYFIDDVINKANMKANMKISVTLLIFVGKSWVTPQMKAYKFLFQNKSIH